ncbi:MAG: sigma-70 family RNA polymerase sigma factor [Candidatus Eisenbacteria bacterium]
MTDQDLIAAARGGNDRAFRDIVRLYEPAVAATVMAMLGDCAEAEDVGQETFVRFYRSLDKFRGESSVKTYLTRIAMNLSLNELKRRKRRRFFVSSRPVEEHSDLPSKESGRDDIGDRDLVAKALARLDDRSRSVIVLRLIDGYSTEETAGILGLPLGTVLSRLARAQEKLRGILGPLLGEKS